MRHEYQRLVRELLEDLGASCVKIEPTTRRNHCVRWTRPDGKKVQAYIHTDAHHNRTMKNDICTLRRLSR